MKLQTVLSSRSQLFWRKWAKKERQCVTWEEENSGKEEHGRILEREQSDPLPMLICQVKKHGQLTCIVPGLPGILLCLLLVCLFSGPRMASKSGVWFWSSSTRGLQRDSPLSYSRGCLLRRDSFIPHKVRFYIGKIPYLCLGWPCTAWHFHPPPPQLSRLTSAHISSTPSPPSPTLILESWFYQTLVEQPSMAAETHLAWSLQVCIGWKYFIPLFQEAMYWFCNLSCMAFFKNDFYFELSSNWDYLHMEFQLPPSLCSGVFFSLTPFYF